jgi:hypothetical protein
MGSKGLEWKYVILIDADMCLINKNEFSEEKHNNDQYLLYVACSRSIENIIIFSKCYTYKGDTKFMLNNWFSNIPKNTYIVDQRFKETYKFGELIPRAGKNNERRLVKIIDNLNEQQLDALGAYCKITEKNVVSFSQHNFSNDIKSNTFIKMYTGALFDTYYNLFKHNKKNKYSDIENIINNEIIGDIPNNVSTWFYHNRHILSWEEFDKTKETLDPIIVTAIENKFNRGKKLGQHTIVTNNYFKDFIMARKEEMKTNYEKYQKSNNTKRLRTYLFNIMIFTYSLETQHYYHFKNKGKQFEHVLLDCQKMFDEIEIFAKSTLINIIDTNILIPESNNNSFISKIDFVEKTVNGNVIWEILCLPDISLKNIIKNVVNNIIYHKLKNNEKTQLCCCNFINFVTCEITQLTIKLKYKKILSMLNGDTKEIIV